MLTLMWLLIITLAAIPVAACPAVNRRAPGPSWFDLLPYMRPSKKGSGRLQQKRKRRR